MSSFTRTAALSLAAALAAIYVLSAAPAAASPLPQALYFPQPEGVWGCSFHETCTPAPTVSGAGN